MSKKESPLRLIFFTTTLFLSVIAFTGSASADEWNKLTDDQIITALSDRQVVYTNQGNSSQTFHKNGETTFVEGRPSLGYWRVDNDQYCSQWPPSSTWACYDVYLNAGGNIVRFQGSDGVNWDGTYR